MIERNDFCKQSATVDPEVIDVILRVGGTNPYGEPLFRVCLAEDRIVKSAGAWNIWDESLTVEERGGIDISKAQDLLESGASDGEVNEFIQMCLSRKPLRTDYGMKEVRKYPTIEGWILEKWKPCPIAPSDWNSYKFEGEPALGPYPVYGEYEMVAGPTPYRLTSTQAHDAIQQNFRAVDAMPTSMRERMILLLNRSLEAEKKRDQQIENLAEDMVKDGPLSLRNRMSLGAGRVMNEHFERMGDRTHHGA